MSTTFDFKTATPITSGITDSYFYLGATSQAAATPSIFTMLALKNYVINGLTVTATTGTFTLTNAKTLSVSNTLTLTATDGSTLAIGTGGTLASAAYVATGTSGATIPLLNGTNTWSGVNTATAAWIHSVDGAASTPAVKLSGAWFSGGTGTTTKPQLLVEASGATTTGWSTSGTGIGVNSGSSFTGNLFDVQVNGTSKASISYLGDVAGRNVSGSGYLSANTFIYVNTDAATMVWGAGQDLTMSRPAAATLQLGPADAAAPVAQTLKSQSALTAAGSNIGGPDFTIQPGLGTGFGTTATYGLGRIVFSTPVQKATGTTIQTYAAAGYIGPQTITSTTSNPVLDLNQTWNNASLSSPTAIRLNVTNTASTGTPLLLDLQVGAASQFSVSRVGAVAAGTNFTQGNNIAINNTGVQMRSDAAYSFSSDTTYFGTNDVFVTRAAAASLRLGAADAATAVAQTLRVQSVVAGTSNIAGANWTIDGSVGTGTGAGGQIIFQTAPAAGSGSSQNALAAALILTAPAINMQPSVVIGNQALATTATDGFLYIPGGAGPPTGVPTSFSGRYPLYWNTTNKKLYVYDGSWLGGTAPGVWS